MTPLDNVALCVELGRRVVTALMRREDWEERVDRMFCVPVGTPPAKEWRRSR